VCVCVSQDVDTAEEAASSFAKPKKSKKSKSSKKKSRSHAVSDGVDTPDSTAAVMLLTLTGVFVL